MTSLPIAGRVPEFTRGDRLRKARELAGYDRQQFAALIGIHRESLAKYESDRQAPRPPVLSAWALATGVDLAWLRDGTTTRPAGPDVSEPPAGIEPATYSLLVGVSRKRRSGLSIPSGNGRPVRSVRAA